MAEVSIDKFVAALDRHSAALEAFNAKTGTAAPAKPAAAAPATPPATAAATTGKAAAAKATTKAPAKKAEPAAPKEVVVTDAASMKEFVGAYLNIDTDEAARAIRREFVVAGLSHLGQTKATEVPEEDRPRLIAYVNAKKANPAEDVDFEAIDAELAGGGGDPDDVLG